MRIGYIFSIIFYDIIGMKEKDFIILEDRLFLKIVHNDKFNSN